MNSVHNSRQPTFWWRKVNARFNACVLLQFVPLCNTRGRKKARIRKIIPTVRQTAKSSIDVSPSIVEGEKKKKKKKKHGLSAPLTRRNPFLKTFHGALTMLEERFRNSGNGGNKKRESQYAKLVEVSLDREEGKRRGFLSFPSPFFSLLLPTV